MGFEVKKATREKIYVKIALMAPSGGGKTYSALRLAAGMKEELERTTGEPANILLANTEQKRGYYYANEFDYDIVDIDAPHNPEKYVDLIDFAVKQGYKILILDSSSHEWEGEGGCLELHSKAGGTYTSWGKVTPRHNKFIEGIADSEIHIISTMRGKDQYEVEKDNNGKTNIKKIGVGAKQRDGFEYEFTCSFLIDQKTHMAEVQKDNTHIFEKEVTSLLSEKHGREIIKWANSGHGYTPTARGKEYELERIIEAIGEKVSQLSQNGVSAEAMTSFVKSNCVVSGKNTANYKKIKDIETAQRLLDALNSYEKEI